VCTDGIQELTKAAGLHIGLGAANFGCPRLSRLKGGMHRIPGPLQVPYLAQRDV
jgi:hypothetical protein